MKLIIDIPKEFEEHFKQDRFKDSLERILEDCKRSAILSGIYEFETIEMLIKAFENGTPLSKGHGRIIDESKIEVCEWVDAWEEDYPKASTDAPTIIEADGGGEDGVSD